MKTIPTKISFKGYDAVPLKSVFIEKATCSPIREEMKKISKSENFDLKLATDYLKWAQDDKTIIERNDRPHLIGNLRLDEGFMHDIEKMHGIPSSYAKTFVTGGNSFIGKYPSGRKWLLIGEDEVRPKKTKADISKEYGIDEKNIFTIPQQYYHLDMFIRPIGYPYVLVDSPTLVKKKLDRMSFSKSPYEAIQLRSSFNQFERQRKDSGYSSCEDTVKALKKAGFKPIEIAGVFGSGINFLNAIINKHQDGTISYITNSTTCDSPFISQIQDDFEKELRQKVPNVRDIYFISGEDEVDSYNKNYMMNNLQSRGGGIHCMSLEEPNFEIWG
ncbi:MAG: hypothetical protein IJY61_08615 [Candidatus Gastranaerophilales bacterium]|nr:hypothetical protein [Candidatus Gastranaerophilales bacterium]